MHFYLFRPIVKMSLFPSFSSSGKNVWSEPSILIKLRHFYGFLVFNGLAHPVGGGAAQNLARGSHNNDCCREKHVPAPCFGSYAALPRAPNSGVSGGLQPVSCSSLPHVVRYWSHDLPREEVPRQGDGLSHPDPSSPLIRTIHPPTVGTRFAGLRRRGEEGCERRELAGNHLLLGFDCF